MDKQEIKSQKGRLNRFLSRQRIQSQQSTPQDQKITISKRKMSRGQSMTVKRTKDNSPVKRASNFSTKPHYKVSTDVISFEMEEQRNLQMKAITADPQLQAYYVAFKKLFVILYQASHLIHQHRQELDLQLFENKSVSFLCLIFQQPKDSWKRGLLIKFKPLASNVIYLANNPYQFQRRIDLVARKVTLQNDKRLKIKNAFLNPKIQRIWQQSVQNKFIDEETETFVEDQFDTPQEKLCFIQIKDFILNKLSTKQFGDQLRTYCVLEEIDDDLSIDFKFQFLLAEQFSFAVLPCFVKENAANKPAVQKFETPQESKCSIM